MISLARAGTKVKQLVQTGIRVVIGEFRQDVTKTKQDGSRGAERVDYGKADESEATRAWLKKIEKAIQQATADL